MKKSLARSRFFKLSSFTLVELLVVIAIIAILASVTLTVGTLVINMAKRAKAANTATQIQTATLGYYTEYSIYPAPSGTTDYTIADTSSAATSWQALICILCGNIHPSTGTAYTATTITNSRGIAFLSLKGTDVDANDAPLNPLATGTEIYFNIAIDRDYDGILGVAPSAVTTMPNFAATTFNSAAQAGGGTSTAGVAVWANCNGKTSNTNAAWWVHTY